MLIEKGTQHALTQMTDLGAVLLDFSAAFDSIAHNLLLRELVCGLFNHIMDSEPSI
jgi:hypothetical protein